MLALAIFATEHLVVIPSSALGFLILLLQLEGLLEPHDVALVLLRWLFVFRFAFVRLWMKVILFENRPFLLVRAIRKEVVELRQDLVLNLEVGSSCILISWLVSLVGSSMNGLV